MLAWHLFLSNPYTPSTQIKTHHVEGKPSAELVREGGPANAPAKATQREHLQKHQARTDDVCIINTTYTTDNMNGLGIAWTGEQKEMHVVWCEKLSLTEPNRGRKHNKFRRHRRGCITWLLNRKSGKHWCQNS